jgi:hypothetical protein
MQEAHIGQQQQDTTEQKYVGNQQSRQHLSLKVRDCRVILWESLSAGRKEERLKVLQEEAGWVIWCKANPEDKGKQAFQEHSRCISTGKCKESKRDRDSQEETSGGKHAKTARSWWKRGDVSTCAAQLRWSAGCIMTPSWMTIKHIRVFKRQGNLKITQTS